MASVLELQSNLCVYIGMGDDQAAELKAGEKRGRSSPHKGLQVMRTEASAKGHQGSHGNPEVEQIPTYIWNPRPSPDSQKH